MFLPATLISEETNSLSMSQEVVTWLMTTSDLLQQASEDISSNTVDKVKQRQLTEQLGAVQLVPSKRLQAARFSGKATVSIGH